MVSSILARFRASARPRRRFVAAARPAVAALVTLLGCREGTADPPLGLGSDGGAGAGGAGGGAALAEGLAGAFTGPEGELAAGPFPGPALALTVDGRHLRDPEGRSVLLRGVNQHGFLDVPDGSWDAPGEALYAGMGQWRPAVVEGTLDDYRARGFNVVRLHTVVEWWQTNPSSYHDPYRDVTYPVPYREMLASTIAWAGERGLYVIFDFFALRNVDGVQSGQEELPWPPRGRFPDVIGSRAEFVALWESVASELGAFPNVLFELYNEPHGDAEAEGDWFDFVAEAIPAIRAYTEAPIVLQWDYACWVNLDYPPPQYSASTLGWIEDHPLTGSNLVYGTHLYRNSGGGGPGMVHRTRGGLVNLWERDDVEAALRFALLPDSIARWNVPLLVTEIGAYLGGDEVDRARELAWFENTLSLLGDWNLGAVGWAWRSDEQLAHGMLHDGAPNEAGQILLDAWR